MVKFITYLAIIISTLQVIPARATPDVQDRTVLIGILAHRGKDLCIQQWSPTAHYLNTKVKGHRFQIVPLSLEEMNEAVKRGSVSFALTNPGNYIENEYNYGMTRIATLKARQSTNAGNVFGAVIFTRHERTDINTLRDLKGKKFIAVNRNAFGGFQMAWRTLIEHGIDPFRDFADLQFSGFPQDRIASAVLNGEFDAGTFRTGILEDMIAKGTIKPNQLRVLEDTRYPGFPWQTSTELYPEWPFSKLPDTSADLAIKVAISLLSMPPDSEAAKAGNYSGWTVPLNYQSVHQLFKDLKIGPYSAWNRINLWQIITRYSMWIIAALTAILVILGWAAWTEYLVKRRTRELSTANAALACQIEERHRAEEIIKEKEAELARIGRLNIMGEMASGLAHELNHPLATIINYANGAVRRLTTGQDDKQKLLKVLGYMEEQAQHAADIIRSLKGFARKEKAAHRHVDLNMVLKDISGLLEYDIRRHKVQFELGFHKPLNKVYVDYVQVEQVILNLARNAIESMMEIEPESRSLSIKTLVESEEAIEVSVSDSGPGVSNQLDGTIFNPFVSTKENGLGLGLSISKNIIEAHGGRIWVQETCEGHTEFRFSLPVSRP